MKILNYFKSQKNSSNTNFINFSVLPDGVFVIEQDGKIIDVNDKITKIYNTTRFNILGKYFSDFVEDGTSILNKICSTNETAIVKAIIKDEDAQKINLEISAIRNTNNQKVYICARNVTDKQKEQVKLSENLEKAQEIVDYKNEFLIEASGSILSNIVSISGFSRALLNGIGGALSEKQEKYLNIINQNSRDLNYDLEKLFTLFKHESKQVEYKNRGFDLISLIKSIERIYEKELLARKIIFNLDYSLLSQRDCFLDSEIIEYILKSIMDIILRFSSFGKCSLNIGHPPIEFLKTREFEANTSYDCENYVLFEAKIPDLTFSQDEIDNIFNTYYKSSNKRPIGLKATFGLLKSYIKDFRGDIWVYSKQTFGTMITFVLPLK